MAKVLIAFSLLLASLTPLSNAFASSNGICSLNYSSPSSHTPSYGFNIDVDLSAPDHRVSNANYYPFNAQMRLSLYSSETVLFDNTNCPNFLAYTCSNIRTGCKATTEKAQVSYINFNATGYRAQTSVTLDYTFWNLSSKALIVNECSKSVPGSYYDKVYGIVGMGTQGSAANNLKGASGFSIVIDKTAKTAKLLFKTEMKYAKESQPIAVLGANPNWHLTGILYLEVGETAYKLNNYNLLFDINTEAIGFPVPTYDAITQTILKKYGVNCPSSVISQPICTFTGEVKTLPNITLYYGNQKIHIPAEVYVNYSTTTKVQTSIQLNLKAISPGKGNENYIASEYYNYIVLGHSFMKHHYTVFNASTQTVNLYTVNNEKDINNDDNPNSKPNIAIPIVIAVVVIFICLKKRFSGTAQRKLDDAKNQILNNAKSAVSSKNSKKEVIIVQPIIKQTIVQPVQETHVYQENTVYHDMSGYYQQPVMDQNYYAPPNHFEHNPQNPSFQHIDPQYYNTGSYQL